MKTASPQAQCTSQRRQQGAATILAAVLISLLMTILMFYGTRVGSYETRIAANDQRQKNAFHAAESGVNASLEWLKANSGSVAGLGNWKPCSGETLTTGHPCLAEGNLARRANTYFWVSDPSATTPFSASDFDMDLLDRHAQDGSPVIDPDTILKSDENFSVHMLMCHAVVVPGTGTTCVVGNPTEVGFVQDDFDRSNPLMTVVAYGESDRATGNTSGYGQAVVRQLISDFNASTGAPAVPLIARSTIKWRGTADLVPNPNAGGEGVPGSVWSGEELDSNGTWRTCEAYEFYRAFETPAGVKCIGNGANNCNCEKGEELSDKRTRYSDIIDDDPAFPDDLFNYYFGYPKAQYEYVKYDGMTILNSCDSLDANSTGRYWITGTCTIRNDIGSPTNPVFIVAAGDIKATSNKAAMYGILFVTDAESGVSGDLQMTGGFEVYGSVMVDHEVKDFAGTFAIVYNGDLINKAADFGSFGAVPGGWSDFIDPTI